MGQLELAPHCVGPLRLRFQAAALPSLGNPKVFPSRSRSHPAGARQNLNDDGMVAHHQTD